MNCQFPGCTTKAEFEILHGRAHSLSTPVCQKHIADEYCSDPKKYSHCRYILLGGDRTFKPDPHVAQDVEAAYKEPPVYTPSGGASCGGCQGCK